MTPKSAEIATEYLFYRHQDDDDKRAPGGLARLWIEVEPNPELRAPIRFAETVSGGVGEAWRATVWMALLAAGEVLDVDPFSLRVTVEAEGAVDGPSAGALMAAAIMAGANRVPIRQDVTITGTLNPDLTIGPVGGIPEKVKAALDAGKKVIGIPTGQRRSESLTTKQKVDVVKMAERRGARVAMVPDIEAAYALMTGKVLPAVVPLTREDMALPPWISDIFAGRAKATLSAVLTGHTEFRRFTQKIVDKDAKRHQAETRRLMKLAHRRLSKGDGVGAMDAAKQHIGTTMTSVPKCSRVWALASKNGAPYETCCSHFVLAFTSHLSGPFLDGKSTLHGTHRKSRSRSRRLRSCWMHCEA